MTLPSNALPALPQVRPKLLVVDDQAINIQVLFHVFSQDHQIFKARSGEEALAVCEAQSPDLILLDVMMPDMDGFEVCRRLKANPLTRDIPVIFVTAMQDAESETMGLDVGAVDFISKPINAKTVRARVKTHLTLKAQSDLLRNWVYIDGLTGVYNRRYFDEQLPIEWARAARAEKPLSLLMLDVDYFKRFNDRYGHQAGDDCLRQVATAIRETLQRPGDLVTRYGGEEFVCLLAETDLTGALTVAEQLSAAIRKLQIAHEASTVADVVTVSIGACTKNTNAAASPGTMLRVADMQLYAAKAAGRNRTMGTEVNDDTPESSH